MQKSILHRVDDMDRKLSAYNIHVYPAIVKQQAIRNAAYFNAGNYCIHARLYLQRTDRQIREICSILDTQCSTGIVNAAGMIASKVVTNMVQQFEHIGNAVQYVYEPQWLDDTEDAIRDVARMCNTKSRHRSKTWCWIAISIVLTIAITYKYILPQHTMTY